MQLTLSQLNNYQNKLQKQNIFSFLQQIICLLSIILFSIPMRNNRIAPQEDTNNNITREASSALQLRYQQTHEGVGSCRICLQDDTALVKPCKCTGTIQYVHQTCMISWIQSMLSRDPASVMKCQICKSRLKYESRVTRVFDSSDCMRKLERLNSCYVAILFCCLLCLIILSVLVHFRREMNLTQSGIIVLIIGMILMSLSIALVLAAMSRLIFTRKMKSITKVYSFKQARQDVSFDTQSRGAGSRPSSRSRSRRTIINLV